MKIKRKTVQRLKKQFFILLGVSLVIGCWYLYWKSDVFTIRNYSLSGVEEKDITSLTEALTITKSGYSYGIFPHSRVLSYSNPLIIEAVLANIPEAQSIDIRPIGLHTIKVTVTLHASLFRADETTGITEEGVLFTTKKDITKYPLLSVASSTIKIIKVGDVSFSKIVEVDKELLIKVSEFDKKVTSVIFPVYAITIDSLGDVAFIDERGVSKVLITKDVDTKKAWSTLLSAIDTDPLKTKLTEKRETLEYLDIRFGNKVFYKFNNTPFEISKATGILENHETISASASSTLPE